MSVNESRPPGHFQAACDVVFCVNIVHTLRRGFYDAHGNKVLERAAIRRRYTRNVINFTYPSLTRPPVSPPSAQNPLGN